MYRIWCKVFADGKLVGTTASWSEYKRKGYAEMIARRRYVPFAGLTFEWAVAETNPWKED